MSAESKVLQINYYSQTSESCFIYAQAADTQEETIHLHNCRAPRTIRCGITGRDEFYAEYVAEVIIPIGSARKIIEVETPKWWDMTRETVLTDLVWLNAKPWRSNKRVTIEQLQALIAERQENWERASTVASDIEATFFRDLTGPAATVNPIIARLARILPLLAQSDQEALILAGLPGLGTNHPLNHMIREWVVKESRKLAVSDREGI